MTYRFEESENLHEEGSFRGGCLPPLRTDSLRASVAHTEVNLQFSFGASVGLTSASWRIVVTREVYWTSVAN